MSTPLRSATPTGAARPKGRPAPRAESGPGMGKKPSILPSSPLFAVAGILLGSLELWIFNLPQFAHALWTIALIGAGFPVVWRTLRAARQGNYATDVVASLSFVTAAIIGQPRGGWVIVLMQTGGEWLE
jgi:cation transport ATPase